MGVAEDDIEDLAADSLLEGLKHVEDLRNENKLGSWLRAIAVNKARRYFGNRNRSREISNFVKAETGDMNIYDTFTDDTTVEKALQESEEAEMIGILIDRLPEINRRIIRLRLWDGYKFEEIAKLLNMNINSTKTVYRRSLQYLKKNYADTFIIE